MEKNCLSCNNLFVANHSRMKYCCGNCRQSHWVKNNPERHKAHQQKYNTKIPKLCKGCGISLPRTTGHRYCEACSIDSWKTSTLISKKYRRDTFHIFKTKFGCLVCGWNKYGSALDFHHLENKKDAITASSWATKKIIQNEYKKCILVCKNCHSGIHHGHILLTSEILLFKPDYESLAKGFAAKGNDTWVEHVKKLNYDN